MTTLNAPQCPSDHPALQGSEDIVEATARALFVSSYADACDEGELTGHPGAGSGEDWMDVAPETPETALEVARSLALEYTRQNDVETIEALLDRAMEADELAGQRWNGVYGDIRYRHELGFCLAMQSLGHGVGWFDDHAEFPLHVPMCEFHVWQADGAIEYEGSVDNRIWK